FSRLPTELRLMIWEAALPDTTGKHLYFWRNHVWRKPRWKLQTDPTTNQEYVKFEFDSRSFGYLEVEVPPFLVNREAHAVALRWIEKQPKIEIRFNTATMSFSFIRLFDPNHDALYLSSQDYLDLPSEIYE
ncbi:2EXR domain-containing protein, partial [Aspergillus homomorphus CBS 101889]